MDFKIEVLTAVRQIPRVKESGLEPNLDDEVLGGRLDLDSFDFAELVVILMDSTRCDPFEKATPSREAARTLRDLARLYADACAD